MATENQSFEERLGHLINELKLFATLAKGVNQTVADDLVQTALLNSYKQIKSSDEKFEKYTKDKKWFKNYVRKALINNIYNYFRDQKNFTEVPQTMNDNNPNPEDTALEKQKIDYYQKFLKKLRANLNEEESNLFEELSNLIYESDKVNISKAAEKLELDSNKAHSIMRRITKKAKELESREKLLEKVGAPGALIPGPAFFGRLANWAKRISPFDTKEISRIDNLTSHHILKNIMKELSAEDIGNLSKLI